MMIQECNICLVMNTVYKILDYLVSDLYHSCFIPEKIHCINYICSQTQVRGGEARVWLDLTGRAIFPH